MFFERSIPRIAREHAHFADLLEHKRRVMTILDRCAESRIFPRGLAPLAAFRILSMGIFGAAALRLAGRLPDRAADRLAEDALEASIAGLKSGSPVTYRVDHDLAEASTTRQRSRPTRNRPRQRARIP
jgi:hypothetical protein